MTGIAIYLEGGGKTKDTRVDLRIGMDKFLSPLKDAARDKGRRWRLVACGSRHDAFDKFTQALKADRDDLVILLVDAEGPLTGSPRDHLRQNETWDLSAAPDDALHLMVQTMEAWIVADTDALAAFYGQVFAPAKLPRAENLETVPKADIANALQAATDRSGKGKYHKIHHAAALLKRIDREHVQRRCPSCARLFGYLKSAIGSR